jgi:thiol-disulfide isomerase/thioredoxin
MRWSWVLLLAGFVVAIGLVVLRSPEPDLTPAHTGSVDEVALEPVDLDGLDRAVQSHKGSVLLVDFWATWCEPCRRDFPKLVGIHERYANRGVVCMSVSLENNPKTDAAKALSFLKKEHAAFPNFLFTERTLHGAEGLEARFGYPGAIPYAALFSRAGGRVSPPDGRMFSKSELIAAIEAELPKQP